MKTAARVRDRRPWPHGAYLQKGLPLCDHLPYSVVPNGVGLDARPEAAWRGLGDGVGIEAACVFRRFAETHDGVEGKSVELQSRIVGRELWADAVVSKY